jgi:hypothetical protein
MSKLERFLAAGLGVLVVLAVAIIFIGPRLVRPDPVPDDQPLAPGETETMTARVIEVLEEGSLDLGDGMAHPYQHLLLHVESGSLAGQEIRVEEGTFNVTSEERLFDVGDRVFVERVGGLDSDRFYISDPVRTTPLFLVAVLFAGLVDQHRRLCRAAGRLHLPGLRLEFQGPRGGAWDDAQPGFDGRAGLAVRGLGPADRPDRGGRLPGVGTGAGL